MFSNDANVFHTLDIGPLTHNMHIFLALVSTD